MDHPRSHKKTVAIIPADTCRGPGTKDSNVLLDCSPHEEIEGKGGQISEFRAPHLGLMVLAQQVHPPPERCTHMAIMQMGTSLHKKRHRDLYPHLDFLPSCDIDLNQRGSLSRSWRPRLPVFAKAEVAHLIKKDNVAGTGEKGFQEAVCRAALLCCPRTQWEKPSPPSPPGLTCRGPAGNKIPGVSSLTACSVRSTPSALQGLSSCQGKTPAREEWAAPKVSHTQGLMGQRMFHFHWRQFVSV